jgi:hypothetical protein
MGATSRNKGAGGERELAQLLTEITGITIKRRVRQHAADHDLEGLPGWAIECKRHATAPRHQLDAWWTQAQMQAARTGARAVLFYRSDRAPWRAVWAPFGGQAYQHTVEADPALWWASARART